MVILLVFMQLTRDLFAIAKFLLSNALASRLRYGWLKLVQLSHFCKRRRLRGLQHDRMP